MQPTQYGVPPEPPRPRGHGRFLRFLAVAVVAAAVGAGAEIALHGPGAHGSGAAASASPSAPSPSASHESSTPASPGAEVPAVSGGAGAIPVPPAGQAAAAYGTLNAQTVANKVEPGMVNIDAPVKYSSSLSEGTGMILSASGLVLTNNHVISGATGATAQLVSTGKTYKTKILGYDPVHDVALLQLVGASGLHPVSLANSSAVKTGQQVLGLGNAQGQGGQPTIAPGKVTALNQTISPADPATGTTETLHGTIQTSAQIQSGDSGGPLANAAGQVIAMDTAASQSQTVNGTPATAGFAIPIDQALQIAKQIAAGHSSTDVHVGLPAFIGVSVADADAGCSGLGFGGFGGVGGYGSPATSGAEICTVYSGTPAAAAGLTSGDVITAVNGKAVSSANTLVAATAAYRPGNSLRLTFVNQAGSSQTATMTLTSGPAK